MAEKFKKTLEGPNYYGGFVDVRAPQRAALEARLNEPIAPLRSPEEAARLRAENDRQYQLGLLAQLSGDEQLQGLGGHIFKQALAGRQQKVTERGSIDPFTGQFTYNPEYKHEQTQAALDRLDALTAQDYQRWLSDRQRAAEMDARDKQHMQMLGAIKAMGKGGSGGGKFEPTSITPEGKQVVVNKDSGMSYILGLGPDGKPTYTPYMGVTIPKATIEKNVTSVQEASAAADRAESLLAEVEKNPGAFGARGAVVSSVPGWAQGYVAPWVGLDEKTMGARARLLRDASMEIHELYGAALSSGEGARAAGFMPNAQDPPEAIIAKLRAARDWQRSASKRYGTAISDIARGRAGAEPTPPPAEVPTAPTDAAASGWSIKPKPGP